MKTEWRNNTRVLAGYSFPGSTRVLFNTSLVPDCFYKYANKLNIWRKFMWSLFSLCHSFCCVCSLYIKSCIMLQIRLKKRVWVYSSQCKCEQTLSKILIQFTLTLQWHLWTLINSDTKWPILSNCPFCQTMGCDVKAEKSFVKIFYGRADSHRGVKTDC